MPFLSFKGKTAVETYHHTVPHHALEFDRELSVLEHGQDPSLEGNLIIEGDNLLALKALLPTHAGKIKCIYIDPPYNTGNEGWVYNDNLTQPQFREWIGQVVGKEGEDATRHDKWCCMMYPRLHLLRQLLCNDGAISISIDDNELGNLLFLCDEVFGLVNRFGVIIVKNNPRGRRLGTELAVEHEYLVVYAKDITKFSAGRIPLTEEQISEYSEVSLDGRKFRLLGLRKRGALSRRIDRPNLHFPLYVDLANCEVSTEKARGSIEVIPKLSDGTDGVWRWSKRKINETPEALVGKQVRRRDSGTHEWDVFEKDYLDESDGRLFASIWDASEFNYETGTDQIKEILGKAVFAYPKPVDLIKHAIVMCGSTDGIVLDSFAGSGTIGQAVLELNHSDGGTRRFVAVQMPHETKGLPKEGINICKAITAERIRRVILGFESQDGRTGRFEGIGGTFTYAKLNDRPLFGEYRDLGETLPAYEEIAKYIFYTETSNEWKPEGLDRETGRIGEHGSVSYYLLYEPNKEADRALDEKWLKSVAAKDANNRLVVYCEKLWLHRDELRRWQDTAGKTVRVMQVPFKLK